MDPPLGRNKASETRGNSDIRLRAAEKKDEGREDAAAPGNLATIQAPRGIHKTAINTELGNINFK